MNDSQDKEKAFLGSIVQTPVGMLVAVVDQNGAVVRMDFARPGETPGEPLWRGLRVSWGNASELQPVREQVEAYMAGTHQGFDLPLAPIGGGPFDREVWKALPNLLPFGAIGTYGEIARRLGRPKAARAVGRANATNPISLIVPCHRVIGANGKLVGYGGGGGVETKRALLDHEARYQTANENRLL